jgi:hypothetical protein
VQFCTSSLGKKVALVYLVAFSFSGDILPKWQNQNSHFYKKKSDFQGLHLPKVRNKRVKIPIFNRVKCPMTDWKPMSKHLQSTKQPSI